MICEIKEEIAHIKGHPKKLVIFLHGYIDNAEVLEKSLSPLIEGLNDIAIHIPEAPYICEIHESKRQWYSMHRFDPNDDRKIVPTLAECVAIYDRMNLGFAEASHYLNIYIDNTLAEYGLTDKDLFLCGFSQGAMLAMYMSLLREEKNAGCASFCGILAPYNFILRNYKSTPDMLLIHGDKDNLIRFEALEFTQTHLKKLGCHIETTIIEGGQHRITKESVARLIEFIKERS